MTRDSHLVQRLIAFLKRPDALDRAGQAPALHPYDDFAGEPPYVMGPSHASGVAVQDIAPVSGPGLSRPGSSPAGDVAPPALRAGHSAHHASTLDAAVMRIVVQFSAQMACIIARESDGRLRYRTGRDLQGRYVAHDQARLEAGAVRRALDSGQPQLFLLADQRTPGLCGPLWHGDQLVGVLYLDAPARHRLHRGLFDVLCQQVARMLVEGF